MNKLDAVIWWKYPKIILQISLFPDKIEMQSNYYLVTIYSHKFSSWSSKPVVYI